MHVIHILYDLSPTSCACLPLSHQIILTGTWASASHFTFPTIQFWDIMDGSTALHIHTCICKILWCSFLSWCASLTQHCTCWQHQVLHISLPSPLSPFNNVIVLKKIVHSLMSGGCGMQACCDYYNTLLLSPQGCCCWRGEGVVHPSNLCSAGYMLSNYDYSREKNRRRQLHC